MTVLEFIQNFQFLRPWWALAFLPIIFLLVLIYRNRQSGEGWRKVCDPDLLPFILTTENKKVSQFPFLILIFGSLLVVIALLGPAWNKSPQPAFRTESALIIILDLSLSMMAEDVAPSRLKRAKLKILDILRRRTEGQTALIVFSLESFTVSPLTQDTNTIALMIPSLTAEIMPSQGSLLHLAINQAGALFLQSSVTNGQILVVTDAGADAKLEQSIAKLTAKGHSVSILGVGTPDGAPIRLQSGGFLKDRTGSIVIPRLNSAQLQRLAGLGGGRYHTLSSTDEDIDFLLGDLDLKFSEKQKNQGMPFETEIWIEQGPWLLILLLPIAAIYFRRGWLMLLLVFIIPLPRPAYAFDWQYLWSTPDQTGQKYFNKGEHTEAAKHFKRQDWNAASNYNAGDYEGSVKQWENMSSAESLYNKGNALVKLGKLEDAIQAYDEALNLDKDNQDAIYNRDLVKEYLKDQKSDSKDSKENDQQENKDGDGDKSDQEQGKQQQGDQQQGDQEQGDQQSAENQQSEQDSSEEGNSQQSDLEDSDKESADSTVDKSNEKNAEEEEQKNQLAKQGTDQENSEDDEADKSVATKDGKTSEESQLEQNKKEERRLAVEQWLRRVPDDPGGLLRRKFRYQAQIRGGKVKGNNSW